MEQNLVHEVLLEQLVGVGASKRTYYSQYREQERRLDRAILSIAGISDALCNTTHGVPSLALAIVRVAAQHFEAERVVLVLYGDVEQRWSAHYTANGSVAHGDEPLPAPLEAALGQVIERQNTVFSAEPSGRETCGAPMFFKDRVVGALVVLLGPQVAMDKRELSVLQTLANQAAAAVHNARLYEESERLRAQAVSLYEEACRQKLELEAKNRQLASARRRLAVAHKNELLNVERNRIARELHDSVAQHVITIGMNLEWCRAQLPEADLLYGRICTTKELARSAVTQMRSAIFELSAIDDARPGLANCLDDLAADFAQISQLKVRVRVCGERRPLPDEAEHALLRIAQEALFNVHKHAQAHSVAIELRFKSDTTQLLITDDGVGIATPLGTADPNSRTGQSHWGLRNMCSRARELGGTCMVAQRRRSSGTQVRVILPAPCLGGTAIDG